jgi:hypothetical protein
MKQAETLKPLYPLGRGDVPDALFCAQTGRRLNATPTITTQSTPQANALRTYDVSVMPYTGGR